MLSTANWPRPPGGPPPAITAPSDLMPRWISTVDLCVPGVVSLVPRGRCFDATAWSAGDRTTSRRYSGLEIKTSDVGPTGCWGPSLLPMMSFADYKIKLSHNNPKLASPRTCHIDKLDRDGL